MDISIQNEISDKNIEVEKEQKNFLETTLGGIINTGLDVGIKFLLPDFIEDEVIQIKDSILKNGFKEGLNTAIDEAIITSGGIKISEINPKTMESKLVKGLFFAGEIIDVDAYTGGFNLQIAYSTGFTAGMN